MSVFFVSKCARNKVDFVSRAVVCGVTHVKFVFHFGCGGSQSIKYWQVRALLWFFEITWFFFYLNSIFRFAFFCVRFCFCFLNSDFTLLLWSNINHQNAVTIIMSFRKWIRESEGFYLKKHVCWILIHFQMEYWTFQS